MAYDPDAVSKRLLALQLLRPKWAIDLRAEKGSPIFVVFIYRCPAEKARGIHDLITIEKVHFPAHVGRMVCDTPVSWLDEQIRRCARFALGLETWAAPAYE